MRTWIWILLAAGCGQAARAPGGQVAGGQAPPATAANEVEPAREAVAGQDPALAPDGDPPGAGADDADDPAPAREPEDPYARARSGGGGGQAGGPGRTRRTTAKAVTADAAAWVDAHNRLRAKHCARALTWSPKLADVAQRWANALRDRGCQFGHSGGDYGENLAAGTSGTLDPGSVVKMWYDEIASYRFPNGGFSMKTGHFTQVVWRGTAQVGCGHTQCKGLDIYVCEYDPPGNWEGQYRENVKPPGCR
ncbi:MAG TPA: CAP domain-containing protein [Kofleriaceae bacterium]|nr:CAP domain-containing protein [Kofleriaceae bacterium]